ncbi:MAG: acyl-CoA dehydrogenase family protein [Rhodoplanes sp.]
MASQEGFNQSPPYVDVDLFASDQPLKEVVAANGAEDEALLLAAFGRRWGAADMIEQARLANENPPKLHAYDAKGFRRDTVEYHPSYHHFLKESIGANLHASTWTAEGEREDAPAEVTRGARCYMVAQVENGHLNPVTMTRAAIAALARQPDVTAEMLKKVVTRHYDPSFRPWEEKFGMTLGIAMTERQGGTDVRTNITRAEPTSDGYELTGHKWFVSAPMSDAFLVLAQAKDGPTAFLVPRFRPDGTVNALEFQRLKDKLGNRSNASTEMEFDKAFGWRIGGEGDGIATIMASVQLTRADCAVGSAGLMRGALAQALYHARNRNVFSKRLSDQPLMRAVLADLALEVEAALALALRLCRSFDLSGKKDSERARARLLTPVAKYWICKQAPAFVAEAMECVGGNGFIEESVMPRLYREAPVNTIWEGSGNVLCLDVLRMLAQDRDAALSVVAEIKKAVGDLPGGKEAASFVEESFANPGCDFVARAVVERLALLAAAEAMRAASLPFTEAFASTRLAGDVGELYGARGIAREEVDRLIERAMPE